MKPKYIVWVREGKHWVEQGDGPLSQGTAERIAHEIRRECGVRTCVLAAGFEPIGACKPQEETP